ncbi:hypothetical protein GIB67_011351, partial [Kingdonia uniflora]
NIRKGLRGESTVLMGKNTMMKRSIRLHAEKTGNDAYLNLIGLLVGNVGLIFTKGDLKEVSEEVAKYKDGAPACVGLVALDDVVVPPGNTGLDPSQTSFFQVHVIPLISLLKIFLRPLETYCNVILFSEAALLSKLGIRPFSYGLVVLSVYDNGSVFSPGVLDLTEDDLMGRFAAGVSMVTSLSLAISYPTLAAAPHMFINAYKNVLAFAVSTEYSFPQADKVKEFFEDPSKFPAAFAPVAAAFTPVAAPAAALPQRKNRKKLKSPMRKVVVLGVYLIRVLQQSFVFSGKEDVKETNARRAIETVEESTKLIMESNKEFMESNKMMSKQLEAMLAKLRALASSDGDRRFADTVEDEVEVGEENIETYVQAIFLTVRIAKIEAGVVADDSMRFDGEGLKMNHYKGMTERGTVQLML